MSEQNRQKCIGDKPLELATPPYPLMQVTVAEREDKAEESGTVPRERFRDRSRCRKVDQHEQGDTRKTNPYWWRE